MSRRRHHLAQSSTENKESADVTPLRCTVKLLCRAASALGFAVILLGVGAGSAAAAPEFEVELQRQTPEVQQVRVIATGGQFRLCFQAQCSADLAFNATPAQVVAAINAIPTISAGGGSVSSILSQTPWHRIAFTGGPLANADVPTMTATDGTVPLSGLGARVVITTPVQSGVSRSDDFVDYTLKVTNSGDEATDGSKVIAVVELPDGVQSFVQMPGVGQSGTEGAGWVCVPHSASPSEPAKAVCERSTALASGASYPTINVVIGLGADAPNAAIVKATVAGGGADATQASDGFDFDPPKQFGIEAIDSEVIGEDGEDYRRAGGHPFAGAASFFFASARSKVVGGTRKPIEDVRTVLTDLPRGFVGNPLSVPKLCPSITHVLAATCPPESAVGEVVAGTAPAEFSQLGNPIFALEPEFGAPVQFGFAELGLIQSPFTLTPRLRANDGYAVTLEGTPITRAFPVKHVHGATICGFGAVVTGNNFQGCKAASHPTANPVPLITNPTRCTGEPPTLRVSIDSWAKPGTFSGAESVDPMPNECETVDFEPEVSLTPTNNQADTPTGLDVEITMPTEGLESPNLQSQAMLNNVEVSFPAGMSVNPSASHGLGSCTPQQVKLGSNDPHRCPLSSQVGTIEIETPLIRETLRGHVFMASQRDNPFNEMIGLYMVFESKRDGITIKIAGKLEADPVTGQLTSTFTENPEWPFSRAAIKFNAGPRAPLINPPTCGTYAIHSELSPWSAVDPANPTPEEIVAEDSVYQVTSGPNGAPCPQGGLAPRLQAGLQNPVAGERSPFVLKLDRDDGTGRFTALDVAMPQGLVAYLKGVPNCPDAVLAGLTETELTGRAELAAPACPAASQIGTAQAGAGAGPFPFYAPGRVFLAGPYKGGPLSLAVVTPAVAGPFDLGNVVVRNAIYVDPITAKVSAVSDPIPTILHGLKLAVRDIRVAIDRPGFTAAPTNCTPQQVDARVGGEGGASVNLSNRFQVGDCGNLGFAPRVNLRLVGGTKRGGHPSLRAVVRPRPGDANIRRAAVTMPNSAFLDQANIRTICTRVQWAEDNCPKAAQYGYARAWSPLLDQPLQGPVYLRSSNNLLPDLVADLRGPAHQPVKIEAAFRTDSIRGGIRSTIDLAPDAPVSRFVLRMQGGKRKGLIVNSRDICQGTNRANSRMIGHNGRRENSRPKVHAANCGKARKGAKGKRQARVHRMQQAGRG